MTPAQMWLDHRARTVIFDARHIPAYLLHPSRFNDVTSLSPLHPFFAQPLGLEAGSPARPSSGATAPTARSPHNARSN